MATSSRFMSSSSGHRFEGGRRGGCQGRAGSPARREAAAEEPICEAIVRFAEATNSDPVAILLSVPLRSAEFAVRCADNKLATILTIALGELNDELGDDIEFLEAGTLIGGFTRVTKDLKEHVAKRDLFAENWLKENSSKVDGARHAPKRKWRLKP